MANLFNYDVEIANKLSKNGYRKHIKTKKNVFKITDSNGTTANFTVKGDDTYVPLTGKDVRAVLEEVFDVIKEHISLGEEVAIPKFGKFRLYFRKGHLIRNQMIGGEMMLKDMASVGFKRSGYLKKCGLQYKYNLELGNIKEENKIKPAGEK